MKKTLIMKKTLMLIALMLSCLVSFAQNKMFPKGEVVVSAGGTYFVNTSLGWSGSVDYSLVSFNRFAVGIGLGCSRFSYEVNTNGPIGLPKRDLSIYPDMSFHMDVTSNWELYLKAGVGAIRRVTEETTGDVVKISAFFDTAIGTRINIYKGLGLFAQVGFPLSSAGLCFAF